MSVKMTHLKDGHTPCVEVYEGEQMVARIYSSPDEDKLRFVLPELATIRQVKIDMEHRLIDFTRRG